MIDGGRWTEEESIHTCFVVESSNRENHTMMKEYRKDLENKTVPVRPG